MCLILFCYPQAMNKKSNSDYIVDPNGPHFPFKLINPRKVCSCRPSPDHGHTPPPMKRTDWEAAPSPENFTMYPLQDSPIPAVVNPSSTQTHFSEPPSSPSPPRQYVCNSCWNPEHPSPFTPLEELLDFDDLALAKEANRYNVVTVETAPNTPPRSPGPSDFLLQEIAAPEAHSSENTGANQSGLSCRDASQATDGAANERAHTSGASCPAFQIFGTNLESISSKMHDSPLVGPATNQSNHVQAQHLPPQQESIR
ncbi:hypothetical protein DSO57_1007388 [Entomophthora muscae]|uniref:Uncharacterized protein n=1 Tax=Entomophthora muscae TaxID=34485 RepID=A0ACC2TV50_9FUNG|nr:hypothetical protein DSO57_1007388 [Entomophthora muscae]